MRCGPVIALLAACGGAQPATTDFFGPTIEPPRGLWEIRPGMSVAEALASVPGLREDHKGVRDELVIDSGVSDVRLSVRIDSGTVAGIVARVQGQRARELLERAWGKPQTTHDLLGQPETTWASESTGWKARLDCLELNCNVEYIPYRVLTSDFFTTHVVPPGDLAKLRIGMKLAEARALAPGPVSVGQHCIASGIDGVRECVAIDDKLGTVRMIYLNLPLQAEKLVAEVWGDGAVAIEPVNKTVRVWPDPETAWRATLREALGYSRDLVFDNYLSAAQLFGDQPDSLDGLPEPVLGKTIDEVKRAYEIQVLPNKKQLLLRLPPTEWERTATVITLEPEGGKIDRLSFHVPYKAHPAARDTLRELFEHKWGEPKKLDAGDGKITLLFHDDPRVEVRDDTEHGAWHVTIHAKRE
jgi:hypothetical protein